MEKVKVLLIDDEQEYVKTLCERLKIRNFDANYALDGQSAFEMMKHSLPEIVVLDLKLPEMDGMEILRGIKRLYEDKIKVIMVTGHGSEIDEREARRLNAYEYYNKPITIEQLMDSIKKACTD